MTDKNVQAAAKRDNVVYHSGRWSLRLSNATPAAPNVYGALRQVLTNLQPGTTYQIGLWCRGQGVGNVWVGGGSGWNLHHRLPMRDYDWTWVQANFTTKPGETSFDFILALEGPTTAVWIDDLEVMALEESHTTARLYPLPTLDTLETGDRFYPALFGDAGGPAVSIRDPEDAKFGGDVRMAWNAKGLGFDLRVLDPTAGPAGTGAAMFQSDSVQIAIDTDPETLKKGYTKTCFEFGFSVSAKGRVSSFAWQPEKFNLADVESSGENTPEGYRLRVRIPWSDLALVWNNLPPVIGVNVLINDGRGSTHRRYVEWAPATGSGKRPNEFVRVVFADPKRIAVGWVRTTAREYDQGEWLAGEYLVYALKPMAAQGILVAMNQSSQIMGLLPVLPGKGRVPPTASGRLTRVKFFLPPELFAQEGNYVLSVSSVRESAPSPNPQATSALCTATPVRITRVNAKAQIEKLLVPLANRYGRIEAQVRARPALAADAYVGLGRTIAHRFVERLKVGGPEGKQPLDWSKLQLRELDWVLSQTERRLAALEQKQAAVFPMPKVPAGKVRVHEGQLLVGDAPFYFGGYGHHGGIVKDLATFKDLGATCVMQGRGPRDMNPDGSLIYTDFYTFLLPESGRQGLKVDFLLSPHIFPTWAVKQWPEVWTGQESFIKYNIDHPEARRIIRQWIETVVPKMKDSPGLLAFCLSNEPAYSHSGRDPYSRPRWIEFLKRTHGSIAALNQLYGTGYKEFKDVPVPSETRPKTVPALRAYYDWFVFNREHFTEWHRWMNAIVKDLAPEVLTHAKIIPDVLLPNYPSAGIDHEELCRFTDLAGNDCDAYWTPDGPFAYAWQKEEMWYDLLHSFAGKPGNNSENHLIPDDFPAKSVPPGHTRSVLWQGAMHHQAATGIWVWEDGFWDDGSALAGSIFYRPANIWSAGQTMIDINRLAGEVGAVNADQSPVAILYSVPSLVWDEACLPAMQWVYENLCFLGRPPTFISERQLAEGKILHVKALVCPKASHVEPATLEALVKFTQAGGKLLCVGRDNFSWSPHHTPHRIPAALAGTSVIEVGAGDRAVSSPLKAWLQECGIATPDLRELPDGQPAWGIEFRVVEHQGQRLVSLINFLHVSKTVQLNLLGRAVDLLTGDAVDLTRFQLDPMEPRLIQITGGT